MRPLMEMLSIHHFSPVELEIITVEASAETGITTIDASMEMEMEMMVVDDNGSGGVDGGEEFPTARKAVERIFHPP